MLGAREGAPLRRPRRSAAVGACSPVAVLRPPGREQRLSTWVFVGRLSGRRPRSGWDRREARLGGSLRRPDRLSCAGTPCVAGAPPGAAGGVPAKCLRRGLDGAAAGSFAFSGAPGQAAAFLSGNGSGIPRLFPCWCCCVVVGGCRRPHPWLVRFAARQLPARKAGRHAPPPSLCRGLPGAGQGVGLRLPPTTRGEASPLRPRAPRTLGS